MRMPVVFVSHGAPDVLLKAAETLACWREIGLRLPEPRAILVVSAHWEARLPTLSLSGAPQTLHDFAGFAPALSRLQYPAAGAPALAERAASLLAAAAIPSAMHPNRGLDHGAWVPLSVMYPRAHLPVTQLSLARQGAQAHYLLGQALAALRDEGVLILVSGAITHNFDWLDFAAGSGDAPHPPALLFADWVGEHSGNAAALLDYRSAPYGAASHPSEEHFLPFLVAMGAGGGAIPERHRPGFTYGGLAMDAYVWR